MTHRSSQLHAVASIALSLVMTAALLASAPAPVRAERLTNADIRFVSFGSVNGEVTDCGCRAQPRGGLDIRAGLVDSLISARAPFLHLDLGNFTAVKEEGKETLTRFLWNAMSELSVDATTPGPRELKEWHLFQSLREESDIPVVSTNLSYLEDGEEKPVGHRHLIVERNGIRIGLIGLIGNVPFSSVRPPQDVQLRLADPLESAKRAVTEIRDNVDLLVLMSEMNTNETNQLLEDLPEIDIALCGFMPPFRTDAEMVNETIVQQSGSRGQYVGDLLVIVDPEGNILDFGARNSAAWEPLPRDVEMHERVADVLEKVAAERATAPRPETQVPQSSTVGD